MADDLQFILLGESHLLLSSGFFCFYYFEELNGKDIAKCVLNTDIEVFLLTVCSTFLQSAILHITLSQLCWDRFL